MGTDPTSAMTDLNNAIQKITAIQAEWSNAFDASDALKAATSAAHEAAEQLLAVVAAGVGKHCKLCGRTGECHVYCVNTDL